MLPCSWPHTVSNISVLALDCHLGIIASFMLLKPCHCLLQEDATEHVGAVLQRVKKEYLVGLLLHHSTLNAQLRQLVMTCCSYARCHTKMICSTDVTNVLACFTV